MAEPRDYRRMVDEANEAAALRTRRFARTPNTGPDAGRLKEFVDEWVIPKTPLDWGLMVAGAPARFGLKAATKVGAAVLGGLLQSDEAKAGPVNTALRAVSDFVPRRASAAEITRAAKSTTGMKQPQLRELYRELGLTGGPPSELVQPSLRSQPADVIARATELKMADRIALNALTPAQREAFQKGKLPGFQLPSQQAAEPGKQAFAPLKREVEKAEAAFDRASVEGRAPRPIFDLSLEGLSRRPEVDQFPLPRLEPEITDRIRSAFTGGAGLKRIEQFAGSVKPEDWWWYGIQEPIGSFKQILGPQRGAQAADAWTSGIAGTSMINPIDSNVRGSSYYLGQIMRGEPIPQVLKLTDPQTGKTVQTLAGAPPPGYGAKGQVQHAARVREYLTNTADPVGNPKPFSYRENLRGNYSPRTVDTNDIRDMVGMPRALEVFGPEEAALRPREYSALEQLGGRAAQRAGQPQAMQQGATWIGGGDYSGLASTRLPLAGILNRRTQVTAAVRGIPPEQAWEEHVKGIRPLLGLGGAAAVGAGAQQNEPLRVTVSPSDAM